MAPATDPALEAHRLKTVVWVVSLATVGLIFDGYDLVVYGTVVSTFLRDPSHIGTVTPAVAGALGSYALVGVLVGALLAGSVGDILGRRKVMLFSYAWFSVGMGITALTSTTTMFGMMRFITGLGVGALVATTGALVSEFAPKGKKNLCNAITYSGVPLGSLLAAHARHRAAGAHRLARHVPRSARCRWSRLLPLAYFKMPESVAWLAARGRLDEARAISERTGVEIPEAEPAAAGDGCSRERGQGRVRGTVQPPYLFPTIVLGLMSATGTGAGLLAQHLAARAHAARRIQRQGLAVVPAGAQRRRGDRRAGGLAGGGPVRAQAGRRRLLRDRGGVDRAAHPQPPARGICWPSSRSSDWVRAAPRR